MDLDKNNKFFERELSDIPIDSSLGLLALGDVAFEAWRKVKKTNNIRQQNEIKSKE